MPLYEAPGLIDCTISSRRTLQVTSACRLDVCKAKMVKDQPQVVKALNIEQLPAASCDVVHLAATLTPLSR
jgi:hypothetical protein